MRKILLALLVVLATGVHAQQMKSFKRAEAKTTKLIDSISLKNGGTVYLYNDRSEKVRFMGQLLFARAELAFGDLIKVGVGATADVFFKKYLSLHAEYTHDYLDLLNILSGNENETNRNMEEVHGFRSGEIGIRALIKDEHTKRKHKVVLYSRNGYRTTTYYYVNPLLPCRNMLAIRAGYIGYNSVVTTGMARGETVLAHDGTTLDHYYLNAMSKGAYLGLANIKIFSAITKTSATSGNVYNSKTVNELYADILFAPTTFKSVLDGDGIRHAIVANDPGSFKTIPIGARIGYRKVMEYSRILSFRAELGFRPGVAGNNIYGSFGYALALIK